jgi:hypothetical protein
VPTTHPRPTGWFRIPDNFADMTEAEKDAWSRAVAEGIVAAAGDDGRG